MTHGQLGYVRSSAELIQNILVPKYYDPSIDLRLKQLSDTRELVKFGDLIDAGHIQVQSGHDIGKITYGTGNIPFVRTSDLADWELKAQPKQGVSAEVFAEYAPTRQDVQAGDIFFVKDGTYLVGTPAYVTEQDLPLLYQSHLLRVRVLPSSPIPASLLLVALSSPIVRKQVKSKQFSAGIIDKIEGRYRELILPIPRETSEQDSISQEAQALAERRVVLREILRRIPLWVQGQLSSLDEAMPEQDPADIERTERLGFVRTMADIHGALIPKYYDPSIDTELKRLGHDFELVAIGDLVSRGVLSSSTGIEVGKMAYGTGDIPFVRTSDLSSWELKGEAKQRISRDLFDILGEQLDAQPGDVLLVRDGTYLVGTSALLNEHDGEMLFSGGIYKLRCHRRDELDPHLLIALLNMPIVRRQMRAKQFTRDIIDTLGRRLFEVVLPIPRDNEKRASISALVKSVTEERARLRERAKQLAFEIEGEDLDASERDILTEVQF
ncbi:hypothetical protein ACGFI3_17255 [Nonomuraea wenchangensis]|uniref:hypothetical protein n=1 Tax=Nonomuraea wenchangensis TaxID=568860 RepID=UPI00371C9CE5